MGFGSPQPPPPPPPPPNPPTLASTTIQQAGAEERAAAAAAAGGLGFDQTVKTGSQGASPPSTIGGAATLGSK